MSSRVVIVPPESYAAWSNNPKFVNFSTMQIGDFPRHKPLAQCPACGLPGEVWYHGVTVHGGIETGIGYAGWEDPKGFGFRLQCEW